jgi:hypothetical protein
MPMSTMQLTILYQATVRSLWIVYRSRERRGPHSKQCISLPIVLNCAISAKDRKNYFFHILILYGIFPGWLLEAIIEAGS